jgi:hypothetical protein
MGVPTPATGEQEGTFGYFIEISDFRKLFACAGQSLAETPIIPRMLESGDAKQKFRPG